jgi:hypothetical protein
VGRVPRGGQGWPLRRAIANSYQERPEEVGRYREAIGYLGEQALSPQDSLDLIADIKGAHARASSA